jgi:hypothetical protein
VGEWTDADSRALSVALVVEDGHRIALRGAERAEAVRIMVRRGLSTETIADRLRIKTESLRLWARRHGITLPSMVEPQAWWVEVAWPSMSSEARAYRKRRKADRAGVAA